MAGPMNPTQRLVEDVAEAIRRDVHESIAPSLEKLRAAIEDIEAVLGASKAKAGAGRPGKRPGGRARAKRSPRGALGRVIVRTLEKSSAPMKLSQIRDAALKTTHFKGRSPKPLYTQIIHQIKQMSNVSKTAEGGYRLKK